ncbi:SusE domain-containing protein [Flavisolibacter ginsenosidimutans]|uniref:SusF/SusE family outer membrane protein n=1 Tax=Flavisolibacter ginsenosidimutans TaxID=661481 RepID=A0A5B8UML3_9BACT|nr:SusE domain-containing protein [Flavisolibacter ginsenosidimutans]QEC57612.1 SusF/SusE family outer membrane protein [Flavisolibacter ginsenosidimutans]
MKHISKLLLLSTLAALLFACDKKDILPYYNKGSQVTLSASKASVTPTAADSTNKVLALNWTSPNYGVDPNTYKYVVEIDSSGRNFANPVRRTVVGKLTDSITGRDLNTILLNNGFKVGTAYNLDMHVISSYGNNNEPYISNTVKVAVTPYADPSTLATQFTSVTGTAATSTNPSNTFSWSQAFTGYMGNITYTLQYDSAGKNFVAPQEIAAGTATSSKTLTQDDMNTTALSSGVAIGNTGKVEYRIKATTAGGAVAYSNVVNVTVATFSPVPANLYIVGDATPGGWNNPVPVPSQQFTKVDAYTFSITIGLTAGKSYLFLPVNGDWNHKYGGAADGTAAGGSTLLKDGAVPGSNIPAPAASGVYKITVNFQTNKYTVTQIAVPSNLYIVGDATAGGWNNPVPTPSQQFTQIDNVSFGIVVNLTAGKSYLFLPVNGDWNHKYGGSTDGTSANGGALLADGAVPGSNTPAPATSGLYKIVVNFATNSYTVTPYSGPTALFIVGDATAGGWNNPVPVPSQQFTKTKEGEFQISIPLTAGKSYLFLPVNGDWNHKYGGATDGTSAGGDVLLADGAVPGSNTPAPAVSGPHTITVSFITNTYKVQ